MGARAGEELLESISRRRMPMPRRGSNFFAWPSTPQCRPFRAASSSMSGIIRATRCGSPARSTLYTTRVPISTASSRCSTRSRRITLPRSRRSAGEGLRRTQLKAPLTHRGREGTEPPPIPSPASGRWPGGEGRVRGADEPVCGAAHLTLPTPAVGPLPLPPEGT